MFQRKSISIVVTSLVIATLACSGSGAATPDITATFAVALTEAFATAQAANLPDPGVNTQAPADTQAPAASSTPLTLPQVTVVKPSDTPAPSNTPGVEGCSDGAEYVTDVTIPDNTVLNPGQAFTKTWRLKNSGTCTWVSSYQFAFVADNQMGGPASVAISGNVVPGSLYDVSVNLVAPNAPGTYKSSWRMKNATGQLFGSTPFVQIVVPAPTSTNTPIPPSATASLTPTTTATATLGLPPPIAAVTINPSAAGGVYSNNTVIAFPYVGDGVSGHSVQAFITFNLAVIPSPATIVTVNLDLNPVTQGGNPFALGCLRGYQQNYGAIDGSDYFSASPLGALWRFCSAADFTSSAAQSLDAQGLDIFRAAVPSGQFQLRLQFNEIASNSDASNDTVLPTAKLIVSYTVP